MIAKHIEQILKELGEDHQREGLAKTPERVEAALRYLTSGYSKKVEDLLNGALFVEDYDEMVVVKDIDFASLCEHHLLVFIGKCHVAYMPRKKIVGLSKIPRLVDMFAKRLQVQERLTTQIANALNDALEPRGVAVVMEAIHTCMLVRGVEKRALIPDPSAVMKQDWSGLRAIIDEIRHAFVTADEAPTKAR